LVLIVAAAAVGLAGGVSGASAAGLSWSRGVTVDRADGIALTSVACPSVTECVGLDAYQRVTTFDPAAPGSPTAVAVDPNGSTGGFSALACASVSECVVVDQFGREVTFDPRSPAGASSAVIGGGQLWDVACPAVTQCTAVSSDSEVTFDPQSPGHVSVEPMTASAVSKVACPSTTLCVYGYYYVDPLNESEAWSTAQVFDPVTGSGTGTGIPGGPAALGAKLAALACPSAAQCTTVDVAGGESTFEPATFEQTPSVTGETIDSGQGSTPAGLACPTTSVCAAVDAGGRAVTFDPDSTAPAVAGRIDASLGGLPGVACPSVSVCAAVDLTGREVSFDPSSTPSGNPVRVDAGNPLSSLSCPSATQCTAVDASIGTGVVSGNEVTFDPASPGSPSPVAVGPSGDRSAVACPTLTQCTTVAGNVQSTFDPQSGAHVTQAAIDSGAQDDLSSVACPSVTQCTVLDAGDNELTLNPLAPQRETYALLSDAAPGTVSCPSLTQCTAVDAAGGEATFDPSAAGTPAKTMIDFGHSLNAVACPSAGECVVADQTGDAAVGTTAATLSDLTAAVSPAVAGATDGSVTAGFTVSASGALAAGKGSITHTQPGTTVNGCVDATIADTTTGQSGTVTCAAGLSAITTPVAISAGDHVTLTVAGDPRGNGIALPTTAGAHPITVSTSADGAVSGSYALAAMLPVSGVSATPTSTAPATPASYTVDFTTSRQGALPAGRGVIYVYLPGISGTCPTFAVTDLTTGRSGTVPCAYPAAATPVPIAAGDRVQVVLSGVTTPASTGPQLVSVLTSVDSYATATYTITPSANAARATTAHIAAIARVDARVTGHWTHTYLWRPCGSRPCAGLPSAVRRLRLTAGTRVGDARVAPVASSRAGDHTTRRRR
jgi:hypothetical protein